MADIALHVFPSPDAIGDHLAARLLERIEFARAGGRPFLLGCPTGRTPRPIYQAMARRLSLTPQDISHVVLVMMDEYLVPSGSALAHAPPDAPWSCHRFARVEIAQSLNAALDPAKRLRDESIWFPDPADP